jgi:hypothetical protein
VSREEARITRTLLQIFSEGNVSELGEAWIEVERQLGRQVSTQGRTQIEFVLFQRQCLQNGDGIRLTEKGRALLESMEQDA